MLKLLRCLNGCSGNILLHNKVRFGDDFMCAYKCMDCGGAFTKWLSKVVHGNRE